MARRGYICKGRKANGQLKKGYTIRNGRVVKARAGKKTRRTKRRR